MHIRTATPTDVPRMVPLINAAFAVETFLEGPRTSSEDLEERMQSGEFLVGEASNGEMAASVFVQIREQRGYFGMLAVDPKLQGMGLGRRMVQAAEQYCRARGCIAMDLSILSLRTELLPFYKKLGYSPTGTEEFCPTRPLRASIECHCIVMSKAL
jgi:ribosomal protein S18 acetylase RimI-like enzyme